MRRQALAVGVALLTVITACTSSGSAATATSSPAATISPTRMPDAVRAAAHEAATREPFSWHSKHVTARSLGKSWHEGCPVGPKELRALHMTFWGFDHTTHHGTLIARARAVPTYVAAFHKMYRHEFPIRRMRPVSVYGGDDNVSMRHDNTSAFNCRYAVSDGPKHWSMHAYGEAVDINTVENPYYLNGRVRPKKGEPYMDRSNKRPGMITPGSVPVRAFTDLGWGWGGNWSSSPDYQHFSSTGG